MKKALHKVVGVYLNCMDQYGDALLKGGSYGCA